MDFKSYTSVTEAAADLQDFLYDREAAIPDDMREQLRTLAAPGASPVTAVVQAAELIYARKDELDPKILRLGAALALVTQQYNFSGMAQNDRGTKMALAMMRDGKVKAPAMVEYPAKENDPEARIEVRNVISPLVPPPAANGATVTASPDPADVPAAEGARSSRRTTKTNRNNTK